MSKRENCDGCDAASVAAADAEEELKQKLKESFPINAPYKHDKFEFALSYITEVRKWAKENLGVPTVEEVGKELEERRKNHE